MSVRLSDDTVINMGAVTHVLPGGEQGTTLFFGGPQSREFLKLSGDDAQTVRYCIQVNAEPRSGSRAKKSSKNG